MDDNQALAHISRGQRELEAANDIHEILELRDQAAAYQVLANAKGFKEAAQEAKIFQLKAERKAGDWLAENITHTGGNPQLSQDVTVLPDGIDRMESSRWQLEASVPDEVFNDWIDDSLANDKEISAAGLQRIGKQLKRKEEIAEIENQLAELPHGKFDVIIIDPPWPYGTSYDPAGRRAANPYPEMSLEEIREIELNPADDCILWLWTTHKFMRYSFELLDYWGFRDVAILTWVKDRMGLGQWLRSQSEFCIMAVKGSPVVKLTNQTTVIYGPMREHSRKPDEFYMMVQELTIGRKQDYFSRENREGFISFGNEAGKFNELE